MSGWLAVDLDGTLAEYHGWVGAWHIGTPVPVMLDRVMMWLADGEDVRIFTARVNPGNDDADVARKAIEEWCEQHLGRKLPITYQKDYGMVELWDDRCVQVIKNTGRRADGTE